MHMSGTENRWAIGRSTGDITILSHYNNNLTWYVSGNIIGAQAGSINFVRLTSDGWYLVSGAANDNNVRLWTIYNNWITSISITLNGQCGDWDNVNKQFTIGTYNTTNGTFYTESLITVNCTTNTTNPSDPTRCTCPQGQVWFNGGCGILYCNDSNGNYQGYNTSNNSLSCNCNTGYTWDSNDQICTINCSS